MSTRHAGAVRLAGRLRDESGQAILLLLLVAISMLFFLSLMYHAGVVIILKMRLQNTADMAAMAGATLQAQGMARIAKLNKEIVDEVIKANKDTFEDHAPFATDAAAQAYLQMMYLARIEQLATQIDAVQRDFPGKAKDAATEVALKNLSKSKTFWRSPTLAGGRLVELKNRERTDFYYIRKGPTDSKEVKRSMRAPAFFPGKTNKIVYTAVEVQLDQIKLGDTLFKTRINKMVAYAAAKPWGGMIGGWKSTIIPTETMWRWSLFPSNPMQNLWLHRWSGVEALLHDPLDYDVWLVSIGDPHLNPRPVGIPDSNRFVH